MSLHERLFIWKQRVCICGEIIGINGPECHADKTWDAHPRISLWSDLEPPPPEVDQTGNMAAPPQDSWVQKDVGITGDQRFSLGPVEAETRQKDSRPEKTGFNF